MSARRVFLFLLIVILATATAQAQSRTITVQAKDTLWSIAERDGTDVATLKSLNSLAGDTIRVGMVLVVPGEAVGEGVGLWPTLATGSASAFNFVKRSLISTGI